MRTVDATVSAWATRQQPNGEVLAFEDGTIEATVGETVKHGNYWQGNGVMLWHEDGTWKAFRWSDDAMIADGGDNGWVQVDMDAELRQPTGVA